MQCIIRSRNDRKIRTYLLYILKSCCKYAEGLKERSMQMEILKINKLMAEFLGLEKVVSGIKQLIE